MGRARFSGTIGAMNTLTIIGGGNIGEALISGLVASGRDPQSITVTNRTPARRQELEETYGVKVTDDNNAAVKGADAVALCVKPKAILTTLASLSETLDDNESTVVVSLAAGITLGAMEAEVSAGTPVVRVMPNTPMLVRQGMSACAPGRSVADEQLELVTEMMSAVGEVVVVAEPDMDAVTALAGSAPAYYFQFTEALIDAGVALGLPRDVASKLATQSAGGAGAMMTQSGQDPTALRIGVSSPAGTTVAGLRELEESGIRGTMFRTTQKVADRSRELGGE